MARVLRILNRFNLGGPTYNAVLLTKFLSPEHETLLIGGDREEGEESSLFIAEQYGIKPLILPEMKRSINPFQDRKALKRIEGIIKEFKPDIVHTHASKAGALGRKAALNCGVKHIVHTFHGHVFHSYFNPLKTAIIKTVERRLASKTEAIVAISQEQKRELTEVYRIADPKKVHVIPLGFDLQKYTVDQELKRNNFRSQYGINDDEIVVSIVGRLAPVKNHAMFIRVAERILKSTNAKVRFVIVGDGEERSEITGLLSSKHLDFTYWPREQKSAKIILTSWRKDIDVVNAGSDIIVLTSLNEGTPVSLIEAQAAGKPIVSTRVGGIANVVLENQSAFLSGVNDDDDFCLKLSQLIDNEDVRKKMSGAGQSFVLNEFDYRILCNRMSMLYKQLLS